AMEFIREHGGTANVQVEAVGKKAVNYFRFNRVEISTFHSQFGEKPAYAQVEELARRYMDEFTAGRCDSVHVASMAFHSMSKQTPQVMQLLPLRNPAQEGHAAADAQATPLYEFTPDAQQLLNELLPITVKTALFQ